MRMRRVGRPGLIGLAARTAVVAGTASAVQGSSAKRQHATALKREQEAQMQMQQQTAAAANAQNAQAPAIPAQPSLTDQLASLAQLHQSGALTDQEFAAAKAQILG